MNVLAFLSMLILVITFITLVFGVIAYFLYKTREKNKPKHKTYEEVVNESNSDYVFFE
jgi:heme/copper-type cytochrome/quinol oxidase subunit 2